MALRQFTNDRPLCFLATVGGVRDIALGAGYLANNDYIRNTLLWQHYDQLYPGYSAYVIGVVFVIIGFLTAVLAIKNWTKWTRVALRLSAMLWLFAALMYFLNGEWALGIYLSGYSTVVTGYLAYYYRYTPIWQDQKRVIRDNYIKKNDPLTHITDRARIDRKGATT